jgi:hypothetical protein
MEIGRLPSGEILHPWGEYLSEARKKANLTQREVSLDLDYSSAQFISNFECRVAVPPLKSARG